MRELAGTLLMLAAPVACAGAFRGRLAERLVYGIATFEGLLLALGLALGLAHQLTVPSYTLALAAAFVPLAALAWRNDLRLPVARPWLATRRGMAAGALVAAVVALVLVQVAVDARHGTTHWDGLWYHLPRIVRWLQQGSFEPWDTPTWQQLGLPVGADVVLAAPVMLGLGWRGTALVTAALTVGAVAAVYVAASDLGLGRWRSVLAACLFASFPAIGIRVGALNSDIAAAFPILAAHVALTRVADPRRAVAAFLVLAGIGLACKATVAPFVPVLAALAVWRAPDRLLALRRPALPLVGAAVALVLVAGSYWPVYQAFGDPMGGEFGRSLANASAAEAASAVLVSVVHWSLEPLAYLPGAWRERLAPAIGEAYSALGALRHGTLSVSSADWQPVLGADTGRSGLVPLLALPLVAWALPRRVAWVAAPVWLLAFVVVSAGVYKQPWSGRFTIVPLAGFALLWAAVRWRGRYRWGLAALVGANLAATLLFAIVMARDAARATSPGGRLDYVPPELRAELGERLGTSPAWIVSSHAPDAALAGPEIAFHTRYLVCPADADWRKALNEAARQDRWLLLAHGGRDRIRPGPGWMRPGHVSCDPMPRSALDALLVETGWTRWRTTDKVDVWTHE